MEHDFTNNVLLNEYEVGKLDVSDLVLIIMVFRFVNYASSISDMRNKIIASYWQ